MSEVEYECLLDAVRTAIAPAPEEDFLTYPSTFHPLPKAAPDSTADMVSANPLAARELPRLLSCQDRNSCLIT